MKLKCPCGRSISNVQWPCAQEGRLTSSRAWDVSEQWAVNPAERKKPRFRFVLECSANDGGCGRLMIETKPGSQLYIPFVPENDFLRLDEDTDEDVRPIP
jgi:hypothetical protein